MKKSLSLLAAAILLLLPSCRFIRVGDELAQQIRDILPVDSDKPNDDSGRITASDRFITRTEVTGDFHAIQCDLAAEMTYLPGGCAITLEGPDNVLNHLSVKNDRGTLVISSDGTRFRELEQLEIQVSCPVLERISINGALDFEAPQGITALDFEAEVNGAGDIDIKGLKAGRITITVNGAGDTDIDGLECDQINLAINGAGEAKLAGRAGRATLTLSGAGNIDASQLRCPDFDSKVRGIGRIHVPKQ